MSKSRAGKKNAFTLIEVMVAVMIISVVLMAMLQLYSNNTYLLKNLQSKIYFQGIVSLLNQNENYGFETKTTTLYSLIEKEFEVEDELRQKLSAQSIMLRYKPIKRVDMYELGSEKSLELGETLLQYETQKQKLLRIRL